MNKAVLIVASFLFISCVNTALGQDDKKNTLAYLVQLSRKNSIAAKISENVKANQYFSYRSFQAQLNPQITLSGNLTNYSKDYFSVTQPDGSLLFKPRSQNYSDLGLSFSQQITATGGLLTVNTALTRFDDLQYKRKQYSGVPIRISLAQPLFGYNGVKWQKKIEALRYQEAEKQYFEELENISLRTTRLYFNVLDAQADLELATKAQSYNKLLYDIENKRISLGTTTKERILQIQLQLLKSQQELSRAKLDLKSSLRILTNFVGLEDVSDSLEIPNVNLPKIQLNIEDALNRAQKNKAVYTGYARRKIEAEKELEQARKSRFSIRLNATYGTNGIGSSVHDIINTTTNQQNILVGLSIPIVDWGRSRARVNISDVNRNLVNYLIQQEENALQQEITMLVQNMQLIIENIDLAHAAATIADERLELTKEQFRFGKTSVTELNIALSEKDSSKRGYINSLRIFWESYYGLRILTLSEL